MNSQNWKGALWLLMVGGLVNVIGYFSYRQLRGLDTELGRRYNYARIQLKVPVITPDMKQEYAPDFLFTTRWKSATSSDKKWTHVYKTITYQSITGKVEEKDLFRILQGEDFFELWIQSRMRDTKNCVRMATWKRISPLSSSTMTLNEFQLDSIATHWKILP